MGATISEDPSSSKVELWLDRWGDFNIRVHPHPPGELLDRVYSDYGAARGYARMLSSANSWPLVDLVARAAA